MIRTLKFNSVLFFIAAALLSLIVACSNGTDTAGVISETESGQTASVYLAGTVKDPEGMPIAYARVLFTELDSSHHTIVRDSTEADADGKFSFGKIVGCTEFNKHDNCYIVRLLAKAGTKDAPLLGISRTFNDMNHEDSLDIDIEAGAPATIVLHTNYLDQATDKIDSICFGGTFICATITDADREKGFITITDVPVGTLEEMYAWNSKYASNRLFHHEILAGQTYFMGSSTSGYAFDSTKFALPTKVVKFMDSLGLEPQIVNLPVPVMVKDPQKSNRLVDEHGNTFYYAKVANETQTNRLWYMIDTLGKDSTKARWLEHVIVSGSDYWWFSYHMDAAAQPGTTFDDSLFAKHHYVDRVCVMYNSPKEPVHDGCTIEGEYDTQDSSIGISFWITADAGSFASEDSAASQKFILSAGNDSAGFKIAPCEKDPENICAQVFSGVDSLDTRIYGKSKALDGKRHHISFIIYWKHVAIAIDGETVHSTDMKLGEKFYEGFAGIQVGGFALEDLFIYEPDSRILNASEKDWTRLKAWLMAFYEMQK